MTCSCTLMLMMSYSTFGHVPFLPVAALSLPFGRVSSWCCPLACTSKLCMLPYAVAHCMCVLICVCVRDCNHLNLTSLCLQPFTSCFTFHQWFFFFLIPHQCFEPHSLAWMCAQAHLCRSAAHAWRQSLRPTHIKTYSHLPVLWPSPARVEWLNVLKALAKQRSSSAPWFDIKCLASLKSAVYIQLHLRACVPTSLRCPLLPPLPAPHPLSFICSNKEQTTSTCWLKEGRDRSSDCKQGSWLLSCGYYAHARVSTWVQGLLYA